MLQKLPLLKVFFSKVKKFVTVLFSYFYETNINQQFLGVTQKELRFSFKNKQQKCMKKYFLICKSIYILKVYSIHYTLRYNRNVENFCSNKINVTKMHFFFFRELQLVTELVLIGNSDTRWSTSFISLKLYVGFSVLDSFSFLSKFIFSFNKKHRLFYFQTS